MDCKQGALCAALEIDTKVPEDFEGNLSSAFCVASAITNAESVESATADAGTSTFFPFNSSKLVCEERACLPACLPACMLAYLYVCLFAHLNCAQTLSEQVMYMFFHFSCQHSQQVTVHLGANAEFQVKFEVSFVQLFSVSKSTNMCAVSKTASFICGGDGAATAEAVTQATAYAYAQATAQASGFCIAKGENAEGYFTAKASSYIEAEAWLTAYAEAVSFAASCTECEAFAKSWAYVEKEVILKAHASAEVAVCPDWFWFVCLFASSFMLSSFPDLDNSILIFRECTIHPPAPKSH